MYERRRRRRSIFDLMRDYAEGLDAWADELVEYMTERPSWDVARLSLPRTSPMPIQTQFESKQ